MNKLTGIFALLAISASSAAFAQSTTFSNEDAASDAVDDLNDNIQDDAERDVPTFGNSGRKLGWDGSVALRGSATSGNTETYDLGIGARLGYFDGSNGHKFNLSYSYGQDGDFASDNDLYLSYDYTRELGNNLYGYGQIQALYSEFGAFEDDAFAGVGLGYRAVATPKTQWALQTGPGYRSATYQSGTEIKEFAWSVGSFFSTDLTETVSLFNDTSALWSESDTSVLNEIGVSVAMSDALALRTSLLTEYHTDPEAGFDNTDNSLGVSIVYNFK